MPDFPLESVSSQLDVIDESPTIEPSTDFPQPNEIPDLEAPSCSSSFAPESFSELPPSLESTGTHAHANSYSCSATATATKKLSSVVIADD